MPLFSPSTLKITIPKSNPVSRGLLYFFLTLVIFTVTAELVARSPLGSRLPAPSVRAESFLFDAKVYQLEQQVRNDGGIDCIFIGSSVTNSDIDPEIIERTYRELTGETIRCFNFGYPAMTIDNADAFLKAVNDKFHPRLIIYTFLPRDLTDVTYTVDFLERSPWFETESFTPAGWLTNHSYAYRYFQTWRYLLLPPNRAKRLLEIENLTAKGFQPTFDIREPYPEKINLTEESLEEVWQTERPRAGLEQLLTNGKDVSILLIEAPIFHEPGADSLWRVYETVYIPALEALAQNAGVTYIRSQEVAVGIPREHWYDHLHFNFDGAETFSQWLGSVLADHSELLD